MRVFCIGNGESRVGFDLERLRVLGTIVGCNALHRDFTPDVICAVDHGVMHEIYHSGICNHIQGYFRDWTKIPEKMYKMVVEGNVSSKDIDLIRKEGVLTENNKGLSKEFVFHGSKLEGVAHIIKKNKEVIEKNISTGQIKVSWIHPTKDRTTSLTDIMYGKDKGWATGPSSGYVACHLGATEVFLLGHDLQSTKPTVNNIYKGTKHYVAKENGPTPHVNWVNQWLTLFKENPDVTFYKVNRDLNLKDNVNNHVDEWAGTPNLFYVDYSSIDNLEKV
tara:strand:- start:1765 stop:2595 length:831 start_codon:yes stop_codon:yes gene_type:complete